MHVTVLEEKEDHTSAATLPCIPFSLLTQQNTQQLTSLQYGAPVGLMRQVAHEQEALPPLTVKILPLRLVDVGHHVDGH
jgi:hypothetical protein